MLAIALVRHDFSFVYVAAHTNRTLPTAYALSAFWGGQEGSLLLWLLVLTGYGALAVAVNRRLLRDLIAWVVPVLGGIATFFAFVLVAVASPFDTQTAPVDGAGLTPSLQNPYMVAHPPMLYLGYVGLSIPFAFAAGAMLSGRTDERWIVATRRWTLVAWMFLGFGQLLGAHWAYVEVGWGGYYAWDPVENAALMPWLAATAFLHSVMIQERKGMLKVWNMVLVALAFELSVFGTFLTRSGVVNSIHSFAKSSIGGWFLAFVVISSLFSLGVDPVAPAAAQGADEARVGALARGRVPLQQPAARRPLPDDSLGRPVPDRHAARAGRDAHDRTPVLRLLPALLRAAAAAADGHRPADRLAADEHARARASARVADRGGASSPASLLVAVGAGSSTPGLIAYTFSAFVLATIVVELVRGTRATGSLFLLVSRNRRRYGGYIVHAAIVLLAIGIAGSSAYRRRLGAATRAGAVDDGRRLHLTYQRIDPITNDPNATERAPSSNVERPLATGRSPRATTSTEPARSRRDEVGIKTTGCAARTST